MEVVLVRLLGENMSELPNVQNIRFRYCQRPDSVVNALAPMLTASVLHEQLQLLSMTSLICYVADKYVLTF